MPRLDSLKQYALPTAKLLATGRLEGTGYFVLSEYLEGAHCPDATAADELGRVFEEVGRMHARGILQEDVQNFVKTVMSGAAPAAGATAGGSSGGGGEARLGRAMAH